MPTLTQTNEWFQVLINRIAVSDPLIQEIMRQLQGQQDDNSNPQRSAAERGLGGLNEGYEAAATRHRAATGNSGHGA